MAAPLVQLTGVDVVSGGRRILHDIEWRIDMGESWAVVGANGAGKTTLLRLVHGSLWPHPDSRGKRLYTHGGETSESPLLIRGRTAFVSSDLQEPYRRSAWKITVREAVLSGFSGAAYLATDASESELKRADEVMALVGIAELSERLVTQLSTGQLRKVLIARALAPRPMLLLLDEFLNGLDITARAGMLATLHEIIASGAQVVYTAHHPDEIVSEAARPLVLGDGRTIPGAPAGAAPRHPVYTQPSFPVRTGRASRILEVRNADVYLARRRVLCGINWTMREGENWAVLGPNGAGKSTFLRLLTGDEHPAAGGFLRRFGSDHRLSIWEIKSRMGIVSPELQADYDGSLSAEEVVISGFFSTIGLYREPSENQRRAARGWLNRIGMAEMKDRRADTLSYGERRRLLLARAFVHEPDLLVLDEPASGLDAPSRIDILEFLNDAGLERGGLIYVTHRLDEIFPAITHVMLLKDGRVAAAGRRGEVLDESHLHSVFHGSSKGPYIP